MTKPVRTPTLETPRRSARGLLRFLFVVLSIHSGGLAGAADQTVLGKSIAVTDPDPGDPARRKVVAKAKEEASLAPISGDPTTPAGSSGAVLQILLDGGTPGGQTFVLPGGTNLQGKPFWRPLEPEGFVYTDRLGENGPVKRLRIRKDRNDTLQLSAILTGHGGPLDLTPPNPGTGAHLTLTLGDGDRTCVQLGPDGVVRNSAAKAFRVSKVALEGCPPEVSGEVLALSYNVAGLPQGISGSDPEVNTPLIAPLLNGYELVLLQETWKTPDPNPLAPLRVYHEILEAGSLHPFRSLSAPLPLGTNPARPSALVADGLNQFSQFPFGEITRVPWNGCHNSAADCLAMKGFSMTRLSFAPGATVDVYNLHMEAGGDPEDDVLRDEGVTQLVDFITTNSAGRAIIMGGDFNLHTNSEPDATIFGRLLSEAGLTDVCAALSCPQPGRIDKFVFRSASNVTITPLSWEFQTDVFVREDDEPLSDHDALAVRFAWTVLAE